MDTEKLEEQVDEAAESESVDTTSSNPSFPEIRQDYVWSRRLSFILEAMVYLILLCLLLIWWSIVEVPSETRSAEDVTALEWLILVGIVGGCLIVARAFIAFRDSPFRLFCAECGKYIQSDIAWQCGYCDYLNKEKSFLGRCERCGSSPKALRCPHCQASNYFDADEDDRHAAFDPTKMTVEEIEDIQAQRQKVIEGKKFELDVARLDREVAEEKLKMPQPPPPPPKRRSPEELVEESYRHNFANNMAIDTVEERESKQINERFRDNPKLREQWLESLIVWAEKRRNSID